MLRERNGALHPLAARTLIGRAPTSTLRVSEPLASGEHASLAWTGGAWMIRDLGSRNGTFVDGRRLEAGEAAAIKEGTTLGFGTKNGFELTDASAPGVLALELASGAIVSAQGGLLALPDDRAPEASIYQDHMGRWSIERDDGSIAIAADQAVIATRRGAFRLMLPVVLEGTPMVEPAMALDRVAFRFAVSRNEEFVELTVIHGDAEHALERRDHHYVLLTLARLRGEDRDLAPSERGWTDRDRLLKMLSMEANAFNVAIHRARHQLLAAGVEGAAGIVEVRSGQRRFGSDRFTIVPL